MKSRAACALTIIAIVFSALFTLASGVAEAAGLPTHLKPGIFCPAEVASVIPVHSSNDGNRSDLGTDNQFAVLLQSDTAQPVSGTIQAAAGKTLYGARFNSDGFNAVGPSQYVSTPIYIELPMAVAVQAVWLSDVSVGGAAVHCPPLPITRNGGAARSSLTPTSQLVAKIKSDAPSRGVPAERLRDIELGRCGDVYENARIVDLTPPTGSSAEPVVISIALNAAGGVADVAVAKSSGDLEFDGNALVAAKNARFAPAQFMCSPVPGFYSLRIRGD